MEEEKATEQGEPKEPAPGWDHVTGKAATAPPGKVLGMGENFGADLKAVSPDPRELWDAFHSDPKIAREQLEKIARALKGPGDRAPSRNIAMAISRIEDAVDKLDRAIRGE